LIDRLTTVSTTAQLSLTKKTVKIHSTKRFSHYFQSVSQAQETYTGLAEASFVKNADANNHLCVANDNEQTP
jgi:hypothetical protein